MIDDAIDRLLAEHWDGIVARAASHTARQVVWERRIADANRFLAAAAILMSIQSAWATLTLWRLVS